MLWFNEQMTKLINDFLEKIRGQRVFFRGSAVLAATTITSYILGLLRDRLLAHSFGATQILGAYEAAFIVPDLILNIFVAGALSAAFVPIFNTLENETDKKATSDFINSVLNNSLIIVVLVGIAIFTFISQLSYLIVPGFDSGTRQIFINLVRLLLISPIIFAVSNTLGNIILSRENFFWYGISAALYNLGTILGVLFLVPRFGIYGVALGTLGGALLHLLARLVTVERHYIKYRLRINFNENYRKFLRLMTPKMIQQPLEELTFLGFTVIASTLTAGAIVAMNFARNFQVMPVNTIGVTFSLAIFPTLSRLAAQKNQKEFKSNLMLAVKAIFLTTALAAFVIFILRRPIISIIFGGGAFDQRAVDLTASTLGVFCLSIPTESLVQILARGFYALKDSLTPVLISITSLIIAVASGFIFSKSYGVQGLALGFFVGSILKTTILAGLLSNKVVNFHSYHNGRDN